MAVTDIACKRGTRLVEIWFKAESNLQNQAIGAQQIQLDSQLGTDNALLKAAANLTGR